MKDKFELRITQDGSIESIYQDGLAEALGATTKDVKRASNVEFENFDGRQGWTVRSASDPQLAIRTIDGDGRFVGYEGTIVTYDSREEALEDEVMFFWELLGWEKNPCPTHQRIGCMTCRYGEPPDACPVNCQGIDLGDGNWSGCSCNDGVLANGQPQPEGWKCDCPQHTGPNPCKEVLLGPQTSHQVHTP